MVLFGITMKIEIDTNDLLTLYRHTKALAAALEKIVRGRMLARCAKCGQPHIPGPCPSKIAIILDKPK